MKNKIEAETVAEQVTSSHREQRLVLRLQCWAREACVVAVVAAILVIAFGEVITQDGKPWWAHILAWLAVWATYDLMKLRKSPQNANAHPPRTEDNDHE